MKDPAFLFYSKDFYEGTRTMLPEERACYVDLLVYQHQNGFVIDDIPRLLMYCSGINEATLKATLKAKFEKTKNGWTNLRLNKTVNERKEYTNKQSINGIVGQFWKRLKPLLTPGEYQGFREKLSAVPKEKIAEISSSIDFNNLKNPIKTLEGLFKRCLNIYANEDANINISVELKNEYGKIGDFIIKSKQLRLIKEHISIEQYVRLRDTYSWENISTVLQAMENWNGITKNASIYLTALKWLDKEFGNITEAEYKKFAEIYKTFILKETEHPARIMASEKKALTDIIKYLQENTKRPLEAWERLLANWDVLDNFYQKRIKLSEINKDLINLIHSIKKQLSKPQNQSKNIDINKIDHGK